MITVLFRIGEQVVDSLVDVLSLILAADNVIGSAKVIGAILGTILGVILGTGFGAATVIGVRLGVVLGVVVGLESMGISEKVQILAEQTRGEIH